MANTQNASGPQNRDESQDHQSPIESGTVSLLPGWVIAGGWIPLGAVGIILIVACVRIGTAYGAWDGWILLIIPALAVAAWSWSSFTRRSMELELRIRLRLRARIKIAEIDYVHWGDFEEQCIILLRLLGYRDVEKTRNLPNVKSVDITALAPDRDQKLIFECKHRRARSIDVGVVDQVIGRVASGLYEGLPVTILTNARLTPGARAKANRHGIAVIDRDELADLMAQVQAEPEDPDPSRRPAPQEDQHATAETGSGVAATVLSWFTALRPEARFATMVTMGGILVAAVVLLQMTLTGPRTSMASAAARAPRATATSAGRVDRPPVQLASANGQEEPEAVVRKVFAAVSDHDWPEVWQLSGKFTGRGTYSSYNGMISGYRGVIRDVLLTATVSGDTVSGRFLAYETGNRVLTCTFTYVVHNGAIVSSTSQRVVTVTS
jgi:hypothetical protein